MNDTPANEPDDAAPDPRCLVCNCRVVREGDLCLSCREEEMTGGGWRRIHGHQASENCGHQRVKHLPEHGD